jgi:hypothetical protein
MNRGKRKREFEKMHGGVIRVAQWRTFGGCVKLRVMKKQASDQSFHDRRYQERKRAEAAKKVTPKKVVAPARGKEPGSEQ